MKELNKDILNLAIEKLPQYEPPDTVWQSINARLQLTELPTYDAPDFVWQNIENELSDPQNPKRGTQNWKMSLRGTKQLRGNNFYKIAIAASVALLVVASFWFYKNKNIDTTQITISTEVIDNQLLKKDFNNDEASFAMVEQFCKTALPVCEQPDFKNLKTELDELNAAHERLKTAIGDYAANPDMIDELTKVENERSTVLRQLVEKIN
jgi:hypothetical protein